jgi:hypothetical protein
MPSGVTVGRMTVSRTLHEAGLGSVEKKPKPKLTKKNIQERKEFAKRYGEWTLDDWRRVLWSDETKICRFNEGGRQWAWKRDTDPLLARHVKQTVKFGGGGLIIWGCMTWQGVGEMCKLDAGMDQELYLAILKGELVDTIKKYHLTPARLYFQHDNASVHTAKAVTEYLDSRPFEVIVWPAQSPDLNPIEHLWAHIKTQLNCYDTPPAGISELWERVQDEWLKISAATCRKLIESMPDRVEAVRKAKGMWTRY